MMARGTILLVEDEPEIREGLAEVLREHDLEVLEAAHGRDALERLRSGTRPCVIVLDLMMPVMDGAAFRQAQLADPQLAPIPVVLVSADVSLQRKGRELQAAATLSKPMRVPALVAEVLKHCGAPPDR